MQRRYAWVLAAGVGLLAGVASCSSDGNGGGAMEPETGTVSGTVAAAGRVYVAARDAHTLYALDAQSGQTLWTFTAGGRIDS